MARKDKSVVKSFFETGDTPTQGNFEDFIDSTYNVATDSQANELISAGVTALHKHTGANITLDPSSFSVIDSSTLQGAMEEIDTALLNARSTGVRVGGTLSVNAGNSNLFDVSATVGQILDNTDPENPLFYSVSYTAKTGVTIAAEGINYLYYLPNDDTLYQTQTAPTYELRKQRIYIGRAVLRGGILAAIPNDKDYIQQVGLQLRAVAEAIGQINLSGMRFTANGSNLFINIASGVLFDFGANGQEDPHQIDITAKTPATFQYITQNASITTDRTAINPDQYDVGGTLTTVGNNKYTIQDVYIFSSQNVRIQYGQNEYSSLSSALSAIASRVYVKNPATVLGLRLGWLIVKKGATDLSDTSEAQFVPADKFGE